jgi:long-chain acyl-CoA synthetase
VSARCSVASIVAESARRYPDRTALVLGPTRLSYAQVWAQARAYAAVLRDHGIGPGDRVALLLPNVPHFAFAYYGAIALGAAVVPVHALLRAEEIAFTLQDSESRLLITAAPLLGEAAEGARLAGVPVMSTLDGGDESVPRIDVLAASAEPVATYVPRRPEDEAVILYTSGTTGRPKGAVLSHDNILWNVQTVAFDTVGISHDDVALGVLPLFHSFGQTVVMNGCFRVGATVVLMPRFDGPGALALMAQEGVTFLAAVPTMYVGLLEAARNSEDRPQLRLAVSGGAAIPVAVIERVAEVFGADIYEGYGLSETSPVATFNQPYYGRKAGSVGCALWGVDVEIARAEVEGAIELMPLGETGEIVIRGHCVFAGYLNAPEATAAVMVDGWFRSGDIGYKDDEGFVFIVDRKKDLIIRGGFNVYPREVEEVLAKHPDVVQVAVVGLPDDTYGEEICAVVVTAQGSTATAEDLQEWARERLGKHKYPRQVRLVESLPLGPSGKVLKREIVRGIVAGGS